MTVRKELYEKAKATYRALLDRMSKRYSPDYQYVISDRVSFECTKMEDIFRPMWGIAPFINDDSLTVTHNGKEMQVNDFINMIMLDGTREYSPLRFDRNVTKETEETFANQSVTEIAAYLVAVCFAKEKLWDVLNDEERDTIASWIKEWSITAIKHSWQNNHYWYPIFCIEILKRLGYDCREVDEDMQKGYDFLENLYYGNGWYSDGELGRFDYYEAWAHHTYTLLWILIADKSRTDYEEKCEKYRKRSSEYLNHFIHYFDSDGGMAAYGRSIGYRFAAIAPFALAVMTGCDIDPGLCKNIVKKNIEYFYNNSIPTEDGCFPVGYLYSTSGFGESYASDGAISCYTEGFLCFLADESSPLWSSEISPLPIEQNNYIIPNPLEGLDTIIAGDNAKNGVTLYNGALHYYQNEIFSHRFNDMAGAYSKFAYNSRSGYALSSVDLTSADNMISLVTPDGTMASHRRRIIDNQTVDGVLVSKHIPFANDPATEIKTWLIPLEDGWHVRIHKVTLSRRYMICEGGFSIGVRSDAYRMLRNTALYENKVSKIEVTTDVPVKYSVLASHPGMHLLCPQSIYPCYETDVLDKGEYIFACAVYFSTDGKQEPSPEISINGNKATVKQGNTVKTVDL
ncbi:MAG: DUF2264 domain-containing protein [Clostridia bacterium]|nr:DUF2264 domain-containing protein [Clostridia bacterium]